MRHNLLKRLGIWAVILVALGCACLLPATMVAADTYGSGTHSDAQTKAVVKAFADCVKNVYTHENHQGDKTWNKHEFGYGVDWGINGPFVGAGYDEINGGYWLADKVSGNSDGSITCGDNNAAIIDRVAEISNQSREDILCGMLTLYKTSDYSPSSEDCASHLYDTSGNYTYFWKDEGTVSDYLRSIINDYDTLRNSTFSDTEKYWLAYDEYMTVCTASGSDGGGVDAGRTDIDWDMRNYGDPIAIVTNNGISNQRFQTSGRYSSSLSNSAVGASSCSDLARIINNQAQDAFNYWSDEVDNNAREQCQNDGAAIVRVQRRKAENVINSNSATETQKDAARQYIMQIDDMQGVYYTESADGVVSCRNIPTFNGAAVNPGNGNSGTSSDVNQGNNDITNATIETSDMSQCFGNASSLGWILCPVLKYVAMAADGLYENIADEWLQVGADEVDPNGGGAGLYAAWNTFRGFANIVFVIILTLIILSQVTGFGISNYGIKKMLPTLIIMAVLVNLSYFLCEVAVDVTNIIGDSIQTILEQVGRTSAPAATLTGAGNAFRGALSTVLSVVGIGAAAGTAAVTGFTTPAALLVPVLLVVVSAVISIIFMFIILAFRKAGVIIVILLSPLAIICYALPNTKHLFEKWKKLFAALLLVYPTCQLLMGGGLMMSGIMLRDGNTNFFYNLVAMLLQIVPLFLIPAIIKSSLSMLGNAGDRIATFGKQMRGRATSGISNSDTVKRAATSMNAWGATKGYGRLSKFNERLRNARGIGRVVRGVEDSRLGQTLAKGNERSRAQSLAAYRKETLGDAEAAYMAKHTDGASIQQEVAAMESGQYQKLVDNAMTNIIGGSGEFVNSAGESVKINPADFGQNGTLGQALNYYRERYDDSGDESDLIQAKAISQLLMNKGGDKGQTTFMDNLMSSGFDSSGNAVAPSKSLSELNRFVSGNEKWMGQIKSSDNGAYRFVNDLAGNDALRGNRTNYNLANKLKPANVPDISDRLYDGIVAENARGTFDSNADAIDKLLRTDDALQSAMSDQRIRGQLDDEKVNRMNEVHALAAQHRHKLSHQRQMWQDLMQEVHGANWKQTVGDNWAKQMEDDIRRHPNGYLSHTDGSNKWDSDGYKKNYTAFSLNVPHSP